MMMRMMIDSLWFDGREAYQSSRIGVSSGAGNAV